MRGGEVEAVVDVKVVVFALGQDDIVAACGRVGVGLSEELPGGGILPTDLGGYGTAGAVEDGAGDDGDGLRPHGFGQGDAVDVL